jgi:TolB-like protein/Tfp pilus assembly protein PilF
LSYASEDAEAARRLCDGLRTAGFEVWIDQTEFRGGEAWDRQIRQRIRSCRLFVPVISANTQARLEGYFRLEWRIAAERMLLMADVKPFLLPVAIDGMSERDAEVPDSFRAVQWISLARGQKSAAFIERISQLLGTGSAHVPVEVSAISGAPRNTTFMPVAPNTATMRPSRGLLVLSLGVALAGVVALGIASWWRHPASTVQTSTSTGAATPLPTPVSDKSIAVLPFVDLSEKQDQQYLGDGMAEEIINLLVKIRELQVIGRTSSFQFKAKADDLRKIGASLGAAYIVEGSIRRSGDHIRVTAQLIDARDGLHRWSETYDRNTSDALKVQDEIAASLVRGLQLEVTPSIAYRLRATPTNFQAYDLYLHGLHAAAKFDRGGFDEANVDFRRVLELDPAFIPAAEALTENLMYLAGYGLVPAETGWQQVREAAAATLKLDPISAIAHAAIANVYEYEWNWPGATREMKIALEQEPNSSVILSLAADERLIAGDWRASDDLLAKARAVDPFRPFVYELMCWVYQPMGRLVEAESACRRALQISPTLVAGTHNLALVLLLEGKPEEALADWQKETDDATREAGLAMAYHALHRVKESDATLAQLTRQHQDSALLIAEVYAYLGQNDHAFKWLETAFAARDHDLCYMRSDTLLKSLDNDPRFKIFLHRMNISD